VRTLAGHDAFFLPAGQIAPAHLQAAKERLSSYAIVILLDEYSAHAVQLQERLGWTYVSLGNRPPRQPLETDVNFTSEQLEVLKRVNRFDHALYCFAKQLARRRTAESEVRLKREWLSPLPPLLPPAPPPSLPPLSLPLPPPSPPPPLAPLLWMRQVKQPPVIVSVSGIGFGFALACIMARSVKRRLGPWMTHGRYGSIVRIPRPIVSD
jgi:hypothetical protein